MNVIASGNDDMTNIDATRREFRTTTVKGTYGMCLDRTRWYWSISTFGPDGGVSKGRVVASEQVAKDEMRAALVEELAK